MDDAAYKDEFLHTNKLGSYLSSTFHYGNIRKYHGLLNASIGKFERINVVNRIIESVDIDGKTFQLSTESFLGNINSQGNLYLRNYRNNPLPYFEYVIDGTKIIKELILAPNSNKLVVRYQINSEKKVSLKITPVVSFRNIHELIHYNVGNLPKVEYKSDVVNIVLNKAQSLIITHSGKFIPQNEIYYKFYYQEEAERGYEASEDLFVPGSITFPNTKQSLEIGFELNASNFSLNNKPFDELKKEYLENKSAFVEKSKFSLQSNNVNKTVTKFSESLVEEAYSFLTDEDGHPGIVAGFPWFDEWSRDTFISMFGLLFATNNYDIARKILQNWGKYLHLGLLPNRTLYPKHLNSLDSVLWYVVRLYQYSVHTQDFSLAADLLDDIESVYLSFLEGRNGVLISENDFLEDKTNDAMTWMDAKINNKAVIDRNGYAVEIQGLWYNFVRILIEFKEKFNDNTHLTRLKTIKVNIENNFPRMFWNQVQHCLYDVVREKTIDNSVRPNQLFLLVLPFQLVKTNAAKNVLKSADRYLLTNVGLKTLNKENISYAPYYQGNQEQRDACYHQGTVWPFLLGIYLTGYLKTYKKSQKSILYVHTKLEEFEKALKMKELSYVPEIFSAEDLKPNGCLSQAWSVATILETIFELNNKTA